MCTEYQAIEILGKVYHRANELFGNVKDAFLYGSYARGDYGNESDVDILIVIDAPAEAIANKRMAMARVTSDLSLEYDITVSVAVKSSEQFNRYKSVLPYYKNVIAEGIRYAG